LRPLSRAEARLLFRNFVLLRVVPAVDLAVFLEVFALLDMLVKRFQAAVDVLQPVTDGECLSIILLILSFLQGRRRGILNFLFQPILQVIQLRPDLPQLLIADFDFTVDVAPVYVYAFALHLGNGRYLLCALPLVGAAVKNTILGLYSRNVQSGVGIRRPCPAPLLGFAVAVPAGGIGAVRCTLRSNVARIHRVIRDFSRAKISIINRLASADAMPWRRFRQNIDSDSPQDLEIVTGSRHTRCVAVHIFDCHQCFRHVAKFKTIPVKIVRSTVQVCRKL
jgi:hypothetical protein